MALVAPEGGLSVATPAQTAAFTKLPTRNLEPRQFRGMVRNITNIHSQSTPGDIEAGRTWYPQAHELAHEVGRGDVQRGAGMIAALSPGTRWSINQQQAREMHSLRGIHFADLQRGDRSSLQGMALNRQSTANIMKAHAIMSGASPHEVLPMQMKTGHFFRNIENPENPHAVTIDTHAHDVAMGMKYPYKMKRGMDTPSRYEHFASAYRTAAGHIGEVPSTTQARTWVTWKRLHGSD